MSRFAAAAVLASGGREVTLGDATVTILAGGQHTGGSVAVLDNWMPAHYVGPPAHVHPSFDEIFSVLEGELTMRLGEDRLIASAGDTVIVPGAVPHTFAHLADSPARVLIVITPGGCETYFAKLAPLLAAAPPDLDAIRELAGSYGVAAVGPPLG